MHEIDFFLLICMCNLVCEDAEVISLDAFPSPSPQPRLRKPRHACNETSSLTIAETSDRPSASSMSGPSTPSIGKHGCETSGQPSASSTVETNCEFMDLVN